MKAYRKEKSNKKLFVILIIITISLTASMLTLLGLFFREKSTEFISGFTTETIVSLSFSVLEAVGLVISAIIAVKQLGDSEEIARATFVTELNKSFVENHDYLDVYNALQNCIDGKCDCSEECSGRFDLDSPCEVAISKGQLSNYLTFFETIYILVKRNTIQFDILDDLFAYRFFLVVHSKFAQQQKLKPQPQNFRNIFCLEREWLAYRASKGRYTEGENTVYGTLTLRSLVGDEQYEKLTKDCRK